MRFVSDPPCSVKIDKMKQRVRWQELPLQHRQIDQTRLVIDDQSASKRKFSFLVIGDSGCGEHLGHNPQRQIAEMMLEQREQIDFVLHTGDVVYHVGASEYYLKNFILPYREFLVSGDKPSKIAFDRMVFNLPFLPVPGNHDYYDLPVVYGILAQLSWPLRHLLRSKLDLDIGRNGSSQGQAYAQAFLDYLLKIESQEKLENHLDTHYTASMGDRRCLRYQSGKFTRLPNRYYTFRYGDIDFFALDSNTFREPPPIPHTREGEDLRRQLLLKQSELEHKKQQILAESALLNRSEPQQAEKLDDFRGQLNQFEETQRDISKRLGQQKMATDFEQLDWLRDKLIESWSTGEVRGRVIYLHHPPYVTEATKWNQGQTLEIRRRLRQVFDEVAKQIGDLRGDRPLVDLVLSGHAHCLEYLRTEDTGHADSHTNWIVCGGSGHSLRRQRPQGNLLSEMLVDGTQDGQLVASSLLFIGRNGQGANKRRPYSFLRIDVSEDNPPQFAINPFITERYQGQWHNYQIPPFIAHSNFDVAQKNATQASKE